MHEGLEVTSGDSKELSIIQKPHDMKIKGPRAIVERQRLETRKIRMKMGMMEAERQEDAVTRLLWYQ